MPKGRGSKKPKGNRRKPKPKSDMVTVWHGTQASLRPFIESEGLVPMKGRAVSVSTDPVRAKGAGLGTVMDHQVSKGRPVTSEAAPEILMVSVNVKRAELRPDPFSTDGRDFTLDGIVPANRLKLVSMDHADIWPDQSLIAEACQKEPGPPPLDDSAFLYHGTSASAAASIETLGLSPSSDGRVYMTDVKDFAHIYAVGEAATETETSGPNAAIVRIKRSSLPGLQQHPLRVWTAAHPGITTMPDFPELFVEGGIASGDIDGVEFFTVPVLKPETVEEQFFRRKRVMEAYREGTFKGRILFATDLIAEAYSGGFSESHGPRHAMEVAGAGVRLIEAGSVADPGIVLAFAILHDSGREDPDHGNRAAEFAREEATELYNLRDGRLDVLCEALAGHSSGETSSDPTIGACWDADRLTRRDTDPAFLSTVQGRDLIGSSDLPRAETTDWNWIQFQYRVLSSFHANRAEGMVS